MNHIKRIAALLLTASLVTFLGCSTTDVQQSPGAYVSDAWITTKVKTLLVEDTLVKATEVNVETYKGVVQLTGFVSSERAMVQAVRVAQSVNGVTSVKNDMRLK